MNNFIISGSTATNTSILTHALSGSTNTTSTTPVKSKRELLNEFFLNKAFGKENFLTLDEINKDSGEIKNCQEATLKEPLPELLPDGIQAEVLEAEPIVVPLREVVVAENPTLKKSIYNNLPEMQPEKYQQLKNDIQKNGYDNKFPIWLYKGDIIDGWNRQKVCYELNIIPNYETFKGTDLEAFWFVVRSNNRRDLSPIQRACWAVDSIPTIELLKKEANKRMVSGKSDPTQKIEQGKKDKNANTTNAKIANEFGTNRTYVHDVQKLKKDNTEVFEKLKAGDLTLTELKKDKKRKQLEKKKEIYIEEAKAVMIGAPQVSLMDANDFLNSFEDDSIDLLFTDPPYSTNIPNICEFTEKWLTVAIQKTKETGRMLVFSGSYPEEIQAFLNVLLKQKKFIVDNPLIWTYKNTLAKTPKTHYNLNYQMIWHLYGDKSAPLDTSITEEMFSVQEDNAPDGRQGNRLHTWQKSDKLSKRLIRHTSKLEDLVVDPFTCTGTFIIAANTLGRVGQGCDIDQTNLDIAIKRGCKLMNNKEGTSSIEELSSCEPAIDAVEHNTIASIETTNSVNISEGIKNDDLLDIDGDVEDADDNKLNPE
jgi:DNA modification methylase